MLRRRFITALRKHTTAMTDWIPITVSVVALISSWLSGWYTWRRAGDDLALFGDLRPEIFQTVGRRRRAGVVSPGGLTIMAANRGRADTEIHRLWLVDQEGSQSRCARRQDSAPLPTDIKARNRQYWHIEPITLGVLTKRRGNPLVLRPVIESGPAVVTCGPWLWIAVPDQYLPGTGQRFKPTLGYRLRTLRDGIRNVEKRGRRGMILTEEALPISVTTHQLADESPDNATK